MMLFEQIENFPFLVLLIQKLHVDVFFSLGSSPRRLKNARRNIFAVAIRVQEINARERSFIELDSFQSVRVSYEY
jgi:hypothetical protein